MKCQKENPKILFQENPACIKHNHQDKILITPGSGASDQHGKTGGNRVEGNLSKEMLYYAAEIEDEDGRWKWWGDSDES